MSLRDYCEKVLIGLSQQPDKLVFVGLFLRLSVIASQSADWRGNPPVREDMYRSLPYSKEKHSTFGGNRYLVSFIGGIATPVCGLARNDSMSLQTPICRSDVFYVSSREGAAPAWGDLFSGECSEWSIPRFSAKWVQKNRSFAPELWKIFIDNCFKIR